mgnify:CR=1 FL=1
MIFRAITSSGDWVFGQGNSSYFTANAAIAANIQTALKLFLNDAFWSANSGIDWINLLGNLNTENAILTQVRNTIANCYGVVQITSVNANFDRSQRLLTLSYNVSTIYSSNISSSTSLSI